MSLGSIIRNILTTGGQTGFKVHVVGDGNKKVEGPLNHDDTDSGGPVKIGGKDYGATAPSVSVGDRSDAWFFNGRLGVFQAWTPSNITTNTSTQVKASAGILHAIVINNIGTTETITVYNNASSDATPIATITGFTIPVTITFNAFMSAGIRIKTAGAGAADITVLYI